jgi:hypothetical protein
MSFIERENEILKTVRTMVDAGLDFVVVGGYAVSALARHRFSVDCDIVVPRAKIEDFDTILRKAGFSKDVEKAGFDEIYAGEFMSYKKSVSDLPVKVDVLVQSLVCKATEAAWSFEYVRKNSTEANILGMEGSVMCRIPEKELLIAFKIHSARRADVRDIVMLVENADPKKITNHLKRGNLTAAKEQIGRVISMLEDENLVNSLKGVFTLTIDVKKQIGNARKVVDIILTNLQWT